MLEIEKLVLGPVVTNTYIVADPESKIAVVIDPAWDGDLLAKQIQKLGWKVQA